MKNEKTKGLDLFTPISEVVHEVFLSLFKASSVLIKFLWSKIFNSQPRLRKIERDSLQSRKITDKEGTLGVDTRSGKNILLQDIDFRRHTFIVGASGFGKTNLISLLQENSLNVVKPIIFFDPKGDLEALNMFKGLCESKNRKCYIFSEHYPESIALNPVLEGTINQVSDRIMRSFDWSEQYYRDACSRSLNDALRRIRADEKSFNLKTIYDYLCQNETKDNVGLIVKLQAIIQSDFGKILTQGGGMTFSQVRKERACLYIGLSTQGYGETASAIGKLFLNELLYHSYKSLTENNLESFSKNNPIGVYFDEFGALVTPEFIELQNKCRGAGIELTIAVQTVADIDRISPELTRQIIENAGNLFVLKQRLKESAAQFSEAMGTILSNKYTYRMEDGDALSTGSQREVHELVVHPDIIKNLRIGQCVLLRQAPTRINLINLRNKYWEANQQKKFVIQQTNAAL